MTTQALYNKWRGQSFDDLLGQEHITRTLRNQIKAGRIGHAYLFTGLRGTGKTSTARIMAKAVNCIGGVEDPPCNQCRVCQVITSGASLDLIEIDAASNRGIDEIRDLRERVGFSPHECRYKVYVIDEVHMLTNEAFNALLKTLEEPPPHVIFILCTTEPQRLPDTILSRCQRFDFRRASVATLIQKLRFICDQEGLAITDEALEFIARRAGGSYRDGESLLDQLATYAAQEISVDLVQDVLGSVAWDVVARIVESLVLADVPQGLRLINQAIDGGAEPRQFLGEILDQLRALLMLRLGGEENLENLGAEAVAEMRRIAQRTDVPLGLLVRAIRLFNDAGQALRNASRPQLPLELAFVEATLRDELAAQPLATASAAAAPAVGAVSSAPKPVTSPEPIMAAPAAVEPPTPAPPEEEVPQIPLPPQAEKLRPGAENKPDGALAGQNRPKRARQDAPPAEEQATLPAAEPARPAVTLDWVRGNWNRILMKVRPRSSNVRALLNSAYPVGLQGNRLVLGCEAGFHRDTLAEDKRRHLVEEVCSEVLGTPIQIECVVEPNVKDMLRAGAPMSPADAPSGGGLFAGTTPEPAQTATPPDGAEGAAAARGDAAADDPRDELLNHPAVKALQRRGGRVAKVNLYDEKEPGDQDGQ
jgi:DNA polymerase-3 subunit gamma/tau